MDVRKHPRRRNRRSRRGLTLIEILVVVTILGIISGIIGVNVMSEYRWSQVETTTVQMKTIGDALESYRIRHHGYPSTADGLRALAEPTAGGEPYMKQIPADAWDNEFVYLSPGQHGSARYEIASKGPDGVLDTDDDIASWKPRRPR